MCQAARRSIGTSATGISTEKTYGNSGSIRETEKIMKKYVGKVVYGEVVAMFHLDISGYIWVYLDISGYIWIVIFPKNNCQSWGVSCAGKGMPWVCSHLNSFQVFWLVTCL